ncbi:hypothetical protein EB796_016262 [Bugula neritina]|uniref:Uncharacterized protein n=1 Tax=Bugula neritina TaxID=10212 RepID=A0A7J7JGG1_BUGNE|nr:hypothetical protein EB796_016262 [Bugula neritina]
METRTVSLQEGQFYTSTTRAELCYLELELKLNSAGESAELDVDWCPEPIRDLKGRVSPSPSPFSLTRHTSKC